MENQNQVVLSHDFCSSFREDIKRYGLEFVIRSQILECSGEKVEKRKAYLARESKKKNSFRTALLVAIDRVAEDIRYRSLARNLKKEIV